jgi:hypothetical protein
MPSRNTQGWLHNPVGKLHPISHMVVWSATTGLLLEPADCNCESAHDCPSLNKQPVGTLSLLLLLLLPPPSRTFLAFSAASCARFSLTGTPTALLLTAATYLCAHNSGTQKHRVTQESRPWDTPACMTTWPMR